MRNMSKKTWKLRVRSCMTEMLVLGCGMITAFTVRL